MQIILHPISQRQLEALRADLPQSLLLSGPTGVGLSTIAEFIAGKDLASSITPKDAKGETNSAGGTIGVEAIRELYSHTRTKQHGRRIIVIDDADRMSQAAQAAFLKLLEEPNSTTYFILTSHRPNALVATIRSRVQHIVIQRATHTQTEEFLSARQIDEKKKLQLKFIAPGLPAELHRLLADETYFEAKAKVITDARIFLQSTPYQKLRIIYAYRANREEAVQLVDSAIAIVNHTLLAKPQHSLVKQLEQLLEAREQIEANHNISLTLTRIVL